MSLTLGAHSPRHLRQILRILLDAWHLPDLTDAASLALTELASNVIRHVPGGHCTILIVRRPEGIRVEVTDSSPRLPRTASEGCELKENNRGLLLVNGVADRWGIAPNPAARPGKTVWFECDAL
ncbi:ATP-binding protein [Streptomyces sp. T-3]|nr:ATP-binding protein [Streptomyces sp. T-3]